MYVPREVILDEEQAEGLLDYWQRRLRLQDWTIQVKVVRGREINGEDGRAEYSLTLRQAVITLADATDWAPMMPQPLDMEWNLVHELIHIVWAMPTADINRQDDDKKKDVWLMEQAVEATTHALITLKRDKDRMQDFYESELHVRPVAYLGADYGTRGDYTAHIVDIRRADEKDG